VFEALLAVPVRPGTDCVGLRLSDDHRPAAPRGRFAILTLAFLPLAWILVARLNPALEVDR